LLEATRRGYFKIPRRGLDVVTQNPPSINVRFLKQFPEFVEFQATRSDGNSNLRDEEETVESRTPEESLEIEYQKIRSNLASQLLDRIKQSSPAFFEKLVVELIVKMGYGGSRSDAGRAVTKEKESLMHTIRFRLGRTVGCAMLVLFVLATTAFAQKASGKASAGSEHVGQKRAEIPKLWAAEEMKWQDDTALPGVKYVLLWGNPRTGEHAMLRKFPAGYAPPPHTHPKTERVIVLSGTIVVRHSGSAGKKLGPGSYSEIPANMEHSVKCGEESECVFALVSPGRFAIKPVAAK
jgi:quercetin dioxygenase-like cupin family protein